MAHTCRVPVDDRRQMLEESWTPSDPGLASCPKRLPCRTNASKASRTCAADQRLLSRRLIGFSNLSVVADLLAGAYSGGRARVKEILIFRQTALSRRNRAGRRRRKQLTSRRAVSLSSLGFRRFPLLRDEPVHVLLGIGGCRTGRRARAEPSRIARRTCASPSCRRAPVPAGRTSNAASRSRSRRPTAAWPSF